MNNCFGSRITGSGKFIGDEWIGHYKFNRIVGIATVLAQANNKWKGDVRIGERKNNRWSGNMLYIWHGGETRFEQEWDQDKVYYSNSTVNDVFRPLRKLYESMPRNKRIAIHNSLTKKRLYSAAIDGVWGRNTLIGIGRFAAEYLNTIDLRSLENCSIVLDAILEQSALVRTKVTSAAKLNAVKEK